MSLCSLQPRIFVSRPSQFSESDCACADDGHTSQLDLLDALNQLEEVQTDSSPPPPLVPPARSGSVQVTAGLHRAPLPDDHELVFNPRGPASVIVLNPPAQRVLNVFQKPRLLNEALSVLEDILPTEARRTARTLLALGLLTPTSGSPSSIPKPQPATLTAWLHVTNQCNLRCPYCYLYKTPDEMEVARGKQAVEAVFRSALANGFQRVKLKYAGGEATLNFPTVLILHDHARQLATQHGLGLDGVILSNGVALSARMIQEMKVRDLRLMISLDGIGATHDAQRPFINGRGSFVYVERTLNRLAAHGLVPTISITISAQNLASLPETVAYVLARELPFTLNYYRENDCSASYEGLVFQDDQIITAVRAAYTVIEANLPRHSLLASLADRARLDMPHDRPCGVGHSYMVIDQFGGVAKCQMEIKQTITDISAPDPFLLIRLDQTGVQNHSVEEKTGCRDCTWRYWCAGGCPALTYRVTGRWDLKSPNCHIYQALFPEVLRLEGLRLMKWERDLN